MEKVRTMKAKTQSEWLKWYQEKTGVSDLELLPDEIIYFHPEHGFMAYITYDDVLEIHHMCGDGKYWFRFIKEELMKVLKLNKIRAYTMRNPKTWERKYGAHIRGWYMEVGIDELKV